ncbi:hypothetical protein SDC9_56146 [bioreactor metagenome]|uniref:Uncharacterized protein n=1 Tax=bioreactor metagenome TaxID=1076179 RepID=A0A644X695_9ZZZZ
MRYSVFLLILFISCSGHPSGHAIHAGQLHNYLNYKCFPLFDSGLELCVPKRFNYGGIHAVGTFSRWWVTTPCFYTAMDSLNLEYKDVSDKDSCILYIKTEEIKISRFSDIRKLFKMRQFILKIHPGIVNIHTEYYSCITSENRKRYDHMFITTEDIINEKRFNYEIIIQDESNTYYILYSRKKNPLKKDQPLPDSRIFLHQKSANTINNMSPFREMLQKKYCAPYRLRKCVNQRFQ